MIKKRYILALIEEFSLFDREENSDRLIIDLERCIENAHIIHTLRACKEVAIKIIAFLIIRQKNLNTLKKIPAYRMSIKRKVETDFTILHRIAVLIWRWYIFENV